ncbi:hypothetical protein FQN49_003384 [Arthroderma sp. PD_2]|nr:hypothetical protein FQN49_003384 [Arthroderma sp. PD_2]
MSTASVTRRASREVPEASMEATDTKWWNIRFFHGMKNDIKRRAPYYWSDWRDAWDYRVVPATVYMYFANLKEATIVKAKHLHGVHSILPALAFSLDMFEKTHMSYGVNEVLLASVLGAVVFSFLAGQPLVIVGVTAGETSAYLSIMVSLLVLMSCFICGAIGESNFFNRHTRKFIEDYGTPLSIIFFTGFVHVGQMRNVHVETLPTSKAFFPTTDRSWLVHFWDIGVSDIFLAIPFAILLTILFYFDHNVSSLIAQGTEFPLRKPAGFHWDIFLLGLTTGIAGILGIPFPNGLIPQAPFHTAALCVTRQVADEEENHKGKSVRIIDHVVEQRASNLAQGLLTLGTMSGPLLVVLHLIPQGVMAGLFFIMGIQALLGNGVTQKLKFLLQDKELTSPSNPLLRIERRMAIWIFVAIELLVFGATFAITQTIAAIGFPVFILLLIPIRSFLLPKWFTLNELSILDGPTASPFTMESVGGTHGHVQSEAHRDSSGVLDSGSISRNESRVVVTEGGVLTDDLENGELYELQSRNSIRRRSRTDR